MDNDSPASLLKNDKFQVFLMSCNCGLPITFARHHWFVVNNRGSVSRWEVLIEKDCCGESWGYLHHNLMDPWKPLGLVAITGKALRKPEMLGFFEGDAGSPAEKMIQLIENSPTLYPHCHDYFITGPNSNTYIQWVLDSIQGTKPHLPWNAFGKGHKIEV